MLFTYLPLKALNVPCMSVSVFAQIPMAQTMAECSRPLL